MSAHVVFCGPDMADVLGRARAKGHDPRVVITDPKRLMSSVGAETLVYFRVYVARPGDQEEWMNALREAQMSGARLIEL